MWFNIAAGASDAWVRDLVGQVARPCCNPYDPRSDRRGAADGERVEAEVRLTTPASSRRSSPRTACHARLVNSRVRPSHASGPNVVMDSYSQIFLREERSRTTIFC